MDISSELKQTALLEFELNFGEAIRELPEEGFYEFFADQFLDGVHFGLNHTYFSRYDLEEECENRYDPERLRDGRFDPDKPLTAILLRCSHYTFIYGAQWGIEMARETSISDN